MNLLIPLLIALFLVEAPAKAVVSPQFTAERRAETEKSLETMGLLPGGAAERQDVSDDTVDVYPCEVKAVFDSGVIAHKGFCSKSRGVRLFHFPKGPRCRLGPRMASKPSYWFQREIGETLISPLEDGGQARERAFASISHNINAFLSSSLEHARSSLPSPCPF